MDKNTYVAYTDGGCNNLSPYGEGASAYVILYNGEIMKEASKAFLGTTNNRMELLAIYSALNACPKGSHVVLYTDSQYAIRSIYGRTSSARNRELIDNIIKLFDEREVELEWVKGHNDNEYNELCDKMCTERIKEIRKKYNIPIYSRKNSPKVNRKD